MIAFWVLLTACFIVFTMRLLFTPVRSGPKALKPKALHTLVSNGPYRTSEAVEGEMVVRANPDFAQRTLLRRRYELRLKDIGSKPHTGACSGLDYYCCRARYYITRVLERWDAGQAATEAELAAAESFMEEK